MNSSITIVANNGAKHMVKYEYARLSKLITTTLSMRKGETEVPLSMVDEECMKLVIEYMEHHKGIAPDVSSLPLIDLPGPKGSQDALADPWDEKFMVRIASQRRVKEFPDYPDLLKKMIDCAAYLLMPCLLEFLTHRIASLMYDERFEGRNLIKMLASSENDRKRLHEIADKVEEEEKLKEAKSKIVDDEGDEKKNEKKKRGASEAESKTKTKRSRKD